MVGEGSQTAARPPGGGLRGAVRRHPWRSAAIALGCVLLIAVAALFNPTLQTRWLLPKLKPLAADAGVERLELGSLRLTPWSLELHGVDVAWRGLTVVAAEAEIDFNPFGLLTDTVIVHELRAPGLRVDLTGFRPGPPSTAPFAGLLNLLDAGYGIALYDVDVTADVQLDATRRVHAELRGDEVRPHVQGALDYRLDYDDGAQRVNAAGQLKVEQLSRGRFRLLQVDALAKLVAPTLPAAERLKLSLAVTPAPGAGHQRALLRERRQQGIALPPVPESIKLAVTSLDDADAVRAEWHFDGLYRGEDGSLRGRYTLNARESLVLPYAGGGALPEFALAANGELGLQTLSGALDLTLLGATRLSALDKVLGTNAALPPALVLNSGATLALQGGRLAITRFDHALTRDGQADPLAAVVLQPPLVVDLADPAALLATPRAIGTLAVSRLPLPWLNGLLAGQQLTGGELNGAFELAIGDKQRVQLLPLQALSFGEVAVSADDQVLVPALRVSMLPRVTKSATRLRLRVEELLVSDGDRRLAGGSLVVTQPLPATPETPLRIAYDLDADVDAVRSLPPLAARREAVPLPDGLGLKSKGDVDLLGAKVTIAQLAATLSQPARPDLLKVQSRQAFVLPSAGEPFENPRGELASVALRGIDLAWVSAFAPAVGLRGSLAQADLLLTAPEAGRYALTATAPLRINGLSATLGSDAQVDSLDVIVTPAIDYSAQRVRFDLRALDVAQRGHLIARGALAGTVPLAAGGATPLAAEGRLELDLTRLAAQPAVRRALDRAPPELALDSTLDFEASRSGDTIDVARLAVDLRAGKRARFELAAPAGLKVRPTLGRDERLARHVVGDVELKIRDLSSAVIERFVALEGIDFAEINADLRLSSNGAVLRADSAAPLRVERVRIADGKQALFAPFTLGTRASVEVEGRQLTLGLEDFALQFDGTTSPALSGRVAATVEPDRTVPLTTLDTELAAQLPQWLSQPVVMPGHKLTAGAFTARIGVTPDGAIAARAALDGLAANAPLAISHIELPVTGAMAADGRGFSFTAPLSANGRSGTSNAAVEASYAPEPGEKGLLKIRLDSALFYLNDLLATLDAVSPRSASAPAVADAPAAPATPVAVDLTRDERAAWNVLPYGAELDYHIGKLFYTDYLAFDEVTGQLSLRARRLSATDVAARFHDSPMKLNGTLVFREDAAEPYLLDVDGTVKDFDLNQFFKELVPGEKPRIKGLFSVKLEADGEMPNLGQLRNETLFDVRMKSRKGVFRPLPPSSTLLVGTSGVLGLVGEGLSYVPTGGFGAGTIARLVNYIARIDYDVVDIRIRRAETRDVVIERFLVRSPTISMTAAGGISRAAGKDILDSPLDLRANLDMSGRGAAILYSMGLLRSERNDAGYWRGPEFKIWGTPAASESNFADIIRQASDGTVKGGITRPLSGLIGNLKYRWFGDKPQPLPPELAEEVEALEAEARAAEGAAAAPEATK